jgi:hypothetical protein
VDSGADICIFDAELAELIGLTLEEGDQVFFSGVTGTNRVAYMHRIELIVGGQSLKTRVAFAILPSHAYGIVGQRGFFEHFRIIFDHQKQQVELRPKTVAKKS